MAQQAIQQQPQPRNIFEQIALGLQTVNSNIIDLYAMVEQILTALHPVDNITAPTDPGSDKSNNQ